MSHDRRPTQAWRTADDHQPLANAGPQPSGVPGPHQDMLHRTPDDPTCWRLRGAVAAGVRRRQASSAARRVRPAIERTLPTTASPRRGDALLGTPICDDQRNPAGCLKVSNSAASMRRHGQPAMLAPPKARHPQHAWGHHQPGQAHILTASPAWLWEFNGEEDFSAPPVNSVMIS